MICAVIAVTDEPKTGTRPRQATACAHALDCAAGCSAVVLRPLRGLPGATLWGHVCTVCGEILAETWQRDRVQCHCEGTVLH
jgi:hypothetical protein